MKRVDPKKLQAMHAREQAEAQKGSKTARDAEQDAHESYQERVKSVARRNDQDIRMIQGVVGVAVGGGLAWYFIGDFIVAIIGGIIGGAVGYFQSTWRSAA